MAQTGYTPIQLYYSTTAAAVPVNTNLANGELAINVTDGKLFYKDNSNVVQVIGWKTVPASAGGTGLTSPGANGNVLTSNGSAWVSSAPAAQVYPGAGIANSTGSAWGTSYSTTGSGTVVALATSPSFTTPVLGTPTSGTLSNCTVDGTNSVGYKAVPAVGAKTTSYTLATTDVGKFVEIGTGGSIVIPNSTFSAGDVVSIFNNTAASVTITCNTTTAYIAGTNTTKASVSLATRGVATVLFNSGTLCVITGNVS